MYTLDFVSDCFFVAELVLTFPGIDNDMIHFILLSCSIFFIIVPLFANIYQLQVEIKRWMSDPDSKQVIRAWMRYNMRILYLLSFISGSAFSAVELCNSYLFQLPLFSMGLSQRDTAFFKNQRIFTIVLLEVCTIPSCEIVLILRNCAFFFFIVFCFYFVLILYFVLYFLFYCDFVPERTSIYNSIDLSSSGKWKWKQFSDSICYGIYCIISIVKFLRILFTIIFIG